MTCTDNKVLVNVAPVAAADKVIIPEKIAEDVYECYKEGAAMVHLHVRDREGRLTPDMSLLEETLATFREQASTISEYRGAQRSCIFRSDTPPVDTSMMISESRRIMASVSSNRDISGVSRPSLSLT